MISATWNAPREAFDNPSGAMYGGKGTADLFLHITSNDKFTGFDILLDFGVFDIFKSPDIPRALEDYQRHLEKHCLGALDPDSVRVAPGADAPPA